MIAFHGGLLTCFSLRTIGEQIWYGWKMDLLFSAFTGWMDDMKDLGTAICLRDTFVGTR